MPELLVLDARDTVGVARQAVRRGDVLAAAGARIEARDDVPAGHKVALVDHPAGAAVHKFAVRIGTATQAIGAGEHVHVHNLASDRMRGDR